MDSLTARQQQVYQFISDYLQKNGCPPTLREISACIGTSGTVSALRHVEALERKGHLRRREGSSRGISLTHMPAVTVSLPIAGRIRAGLLHPAVEDIIGHLSIDKSLVKGAGCFFLRVEGESMINKGILDGDYAMIRPQQIAENGDIVAVMVDGDATLKQFYRKRDHILLQPANPNMAPIILRPGDGEVTVVGKMVGLFRGME